MAWRPAWSCHFGSSHLLIAPQAGLHGSGGVRQSSVSRGAITRWHPLAAGNLAVCHLSVWLSLWTGHWKASIFGRWGEVKVAEPVPELDPVLEAWDRLVRRAVKFVSRRRRIGLAFASYRDYTLRNTPPSRPTQARVARRRVASRGPISGIPPLQRVRPSSAMDPTEAELAAISDLAGATAWAGLDGALLRTLQAALGNVQRVREVALIPRTLWDTTVATLQVAVSAEPADGNRALTPAELARIESFRRVCFLRVGRQTDSPGDPSSTAPTPVGAGAPFPHAGGGTGSPNARKLKLSSILDPTLDAEVQIMSTTEITNCYEEYKKRFGDYPTPESDVSPDQLSALKQVLESGSVPFADFSVFGPFGTRRLRKQTFMSYHLNVATGEWSKRELPGPADFHSWYQDWKCYRTGMLLLEACQAEHLDAYSEFIRGQVGQFGDEAWWLICRADGRLRSEHLERIRRNLRTNPAYAFTEQTPWSACFAASIKDSDFWTKELATPATLWLARAKPGGGSATDEAPGSPDNPIGRGRHVPVIPPETTGPFLGTMAPTASTGRALRSAGPTTRTSVAAKLHKESARTSGRINAIVAWDRIRPWFALERARRPPTDQPRRRQVVAACQKPSSHPPRVTRHNLESRVRDNHCRGRRGKRQRSRDLPRDLRRSVNGGTSRSPRGQRQKRRLRRPRSLLTLQP